MKIGDMYNPAVAVPYAVRKPIRSSTTESSSLISASAWNCRSSFFLFRRMRRRSEMCWRSSGMIFVMYAMNASRYTNSIKPMMSSR